VPFAEFPFVSSSQPSWCFAILLVVYHLAHPLAPQKGIDAFAAIRFVSDNMNGSSVVVFQRALH
jgi:hypothetical protein